jgi:hypothetical protein
MTTIARPPARWRHRSAARGPGQDLVLAARRTERLEQLRAGLGTRAIAPTTGLPEVIGGDGITNLE